MPDPEIRISNVRCMCDLRLRLGGMSMLIGPNGSGKSTITERTELSSSFSCLEPEAARGSGCGEGGWR